MFLLLRITCENLRLRSIRLIHIIFSPQKIFFDLAKVGREKWLLRIERVVY